MEPLIFDDIAPVEIPVRVGSRSYILREASEAAASQYKNAQLKAMKLAESADGSKHSSIDGMAETEALLVSLCLFEKTENGGERTVPILEIKKLPHRIIKPLFEKAEAISGLQNKETKEEIVKKIKELQGKLQKTNAEERTEESEAKNS